MAAVVLVLALSAACATQGPTGNEVPPTWLTALIHEFESQPAANPPAFIARYDYKGLAVYYLPPRCCDIWSNLYDAAGSVICHPDGGLSGTGDGRCTDFFTERAGEKVIWRDARGNT